MRDTGYAKELKSSSLPFGDGSEARIERLFIKQLGQEEIRFSWWKDNNIVTRPLDLSEEALIKLMARGIRDGVLSPKFLAALQVELAAS